jgi:hypothetical protein
MVQRLLRHLHGELFCTLKSITIVTAYKKVLREDGAISAEICRRKSAN